MTINEQIDAMVDDVCKNFDCAEDYLEFMNNTIFDGMVFDAMMDAEADIHDFERDPANDVCIYNATYVLGFPSGLDEDCELCDEYRYHIKRSILLFVYYRALTKFTIKFRQTIDNLE